MGLYFFLPTSSNMAMAFAALAERLPVALVQSFEGARTCAADQPLLALFVCVLLLAAWLQSRVTERPWVPAQPFSGPELAKAGFGPADVSDGAPAAANVGGKPVVPALTQSALSVGDRLYLDGVRRTLLGLPYLEVSTQTLVHESSGHTRVLPAGAPFDLAARYDGLDFSINTLSMVGWRRLASLQACIEDVVARGVPGDFIETGVFRGGGALLMRACLAVTDQYDKVGSGRPSRGAKSDRPKLVSGAFARRVFAADSYAGPGADDHAQTAPPNRLLAAVITWTVAGLAGLPVSNDFLIKMLQAFVTVIRTVERLLCWRTKANGEGAFPPSKRPLTAEAVEVIRAFMRASPLLARLAYAVPTVGAGIESVASHFARLGMPIEDGRTVLLKGFFSDTLPGAPFDRLAVLRLDGDTYESTEVVLRTCYDRLSPGGYCIIDDYQAFAECAASVDEFRAARGITAPLQDVDGTAVYWIKE